MSDELCALCGCRQESPAAMELCVKASGDNSHVWAPGIGAPPHPPFDFLVHLQRQREWSARTFGPGARTQGVIDHIRKELREIESDPSDVVEWIDVVILGLDGAWRAGFTPQAIIAALRDKQARNEARDWPDWRTQPEDKAIEHVRAGVTPPHASHPQIEEKNDDDDLTRVDSL